MVTEADERMPESSRLRQHSTPAIEHRRMSIFKRAFLSRGVNEAVDATWPSFSPFSVLANVPWPASMGVSTGWLLIFLASGLDKTILAISLRSEEHPYDLDESYHIKRIVDGKPFDCDIFFKKKKSDLS